MFQQIKKEERHNFVMKATYEGWDYNTHNVITNLWRIEDEIEKLFESTKHRWLHILFSDGISF